VLRSRSPRVNCEPTLVLTGQDVSTLLSIDECILAVENAFRLLGEGAAAPPGTLGVHGPEGSFHVKAGCLQLNRNYFAAKVNGNFPSNPQRFGLPTIQGIIVLCDAEHGSPLAVMDSIAITNLRTGAATAVAAKYLARSEASVVTICGCGNQGRIQLQALRAVRHLRQAFAYDKDQEQALRFARELTEELRIPVSHAPVLSAATRQSDIVVTCTPSQQAFLGLEDVAPGTFVAAVGADNPLKSEIQPALMSRSRVVVDLLEQCAIIGDLHHAVKAGAMTQAQVHAELGDVVAGRASVNSKEEIIIFDSTGLALQDVAAAAIVYEKAKGERRGLPVNFAPSASGASSHEAPRTRLA
jgi:alanine dehydrogenase